jgi:hypothetical protein
VSVGADPPRRRKNAQRMRQTTRWVPSGWRWALPAFDRWHSPRQPAGSISSLTHGQRLMVPLSRHQILTSPLTIVFAFRILVPQHVVCSSDLAQVREDTGKRRLRRIPSGRWPSALGGEHLHAYPGGAEVTTATVSDMKRREGEKKYLEVRATNGCRRIAGCNTDQTVWTLHLFFLRVVFWGSASDRYG